MPQRIERRYVLETRLHEIENEIGELRDQLMLLRGFEQTPERKARIDALMARYYELGDKFVAVYREWNALEV